MGILACSAVDILPDPAVGMLPSPAVDILPDPAVGILPSPAADILPDPCSCGHFTWFNNGDFI